MAEGLWKKQQGICDKAVNDPDNILHVLQIRYTEAKIFRTTVMCKNKLELETHVAEMYM